MGGTKVLVVDDDAALRLLCRINLELDGYLVHEAESVAVARVVLAQEAIDVLLLDVHIGHDDGIAFLRSLRAEGFPVSVALFTGSAQIGGPERLLADSVLPKPFELDELSDTVRSLAGLRRGSATVRRS